MASILQTDDGWRAFIRRKGFKSESKVFKRKSDAEKWVRSVESKMDSGLHVTASKDTLKSLLERYRDEVCDTRSGGRWERLRITAFLAHPSTQFQHKAVSKVTPQDIDSWINARTKEVSGETVLREVGLLSGVFTHAIKKWRIPMAQHPVHMANKPKGSKHRTRRVADSEIELVVKLLNTTPKLSLVWYTCYMFVFAVETGLRLSEITRLQPENIFLEQSYLEVLKSKNGDARSVPLTSRAKEILREVGCQFPVSADSAGTVWRRVFKQLGITGLHFHDSRHEACTRLSKYYTVLELAKIIGHRDLRSLMIYYNPTAVELAQKLHAPAQPILQHPSPPTDLASAA